MTIPALQDGQLKDDLLDIQKDIERQAVEKGFDHTKTSVWKLTSSLVRAIEEYHAAKTG